MGSKSSSKQTTAVTTNTNTSTGDIGVTGKDAANLIGQLTGASLAANEQANILAVNSFDSIKDTYISSLNNITAQQSNITDLTKTAIEATAGSPASSLAKIAGFAVVGIAAVKFLKR